MKKTIPFMISIIAIASIASTAILGNTQTAYAGFLPITSCTITPTMVNVQLGPNESVEIPKTIECFGGNIDGFTLSSTDCTLNDVDFSGTALNNNIIDFTETILNLGDTSEEHCTAVYLILDENFDETFLTQEIWINEPQPEPPVVGGELLPIDSTALVLAGLQTSAIWMLPVLAGVAGSAFGILYIKSRRN